MVRLGVGQCDSGGSSASPSRPAALRAGGQERGSRLAASGGESLRVAGEEAAGRGGQHPEERVSPAAG